MYINTFMLNINPGEYSDGLIIVEAKESANVRFAIIVRHVVGLFVIVA
jgi:hypothetical protein